MRKIILILLAVTTLFVTACKKLEEYNVDHKSATNVAGATLFTNAQKNLVDQVVTPSNNTNPLRLFAQYWAQTTYIDESKFDLTTRKIPDNEFAIIYRDVLMDLKEAKTLIDAESTLITPEAQKKNKIAITEILSVYAFHRLVDIFGDIPYEEALDPSKIAPKYDKAKDVYVKLFTRLNDAIAMLNPASGSFGGSDIIYGGSVAKWKLFANSLKVKMAISVADVDDLNPGAKINEAVTSGVFASSSDNANFNYLSAQPNANPVYVNLVASGRKDFVAANTIVDKMNALSDPRRALYFDANVAGGVYKGGTYGAPNKYSDFTHVSASLTAATFRGVLLDYVEVQFYLAEAAARGLIAGSAETYYNAAITASILSWGGTNADATTYLANPSVAYTTATGTYKEKIGTQAWIAFYDRGEIGWNTWRRLDAPTFNAPPGMTIADIPRRYTYPVSEQTLNPDGYAQGTASIGGDTKTTKLFWDKQ